MARLPYLGPDDLPPEHRDLLKRDIHLARLLAHAPEAARKMNALGMWIRHECTLDARLRELAILQVGWCARNPYEWSHHVKIAREFGVSDDDIRAVGLESGGGRAPDGTGVLPPARSGLDDTARLVLRAAREATLDGAMSGDSVSALTAALGPQRLVELVVIVSFYCAVVRLLASLAIDVEADYAPLLVEFPLPGTP